MRASHLLISDRLIRVSNLIWLHKLNLRGFQERREWRSTRDLHLAMAGGDGSPSSAAAAASTDDVPAVLRDANWEASRKEDLLVPGLDLSDSD